VRVAKVLLEIVCSSLDDCLTAERGGTDRIELCAAIATGGLTPSLGTLIEAKKRLRIPIVTMVRPRAGGFCYCEEDFSVMRRDAALLLEHGADGIVFGILRSDGTLDISRCGNMVALAGARQTVFHRAFDVTPDAVNALDDLIDLGFTRVLTSGGQKTALEGSDLIRRLIVTAGRRIEVLPGGGVRAYNVRQLVEATGCTQVHMTAFSARTDPSAFTSPLSFGSIPDSPSSSYGHVDCETVQRMREALDAAAPPG
jgi:copper homeostasis protein